MSQTPWDQLLTINIVQRKHSAEFDSSDLHHVAGTGGIWIKQTEHTQVIIPDNQDTRRIITLAPKGQEGDVWMMKMRSPTVGIFRWKLQSNPNAHITIKTTV